jgi:hypothetical protein
MTEPDPSRRPTAAEALKLIHNYHDGFTRAQLKGPVPEPVIDPMTMTERFRRITEANARHDAREKKRLDAKVKEASAVSS